jgi:hypothetical protein
MEQTMQNDFIGPNKDGSSLLKKFRACGVALLVAASAVVGVHSAKLAYSDDFDLVKVDSGKAYSIHGFSRAAFGVFYGTMDAGVKVNRSLKDAGVNPDLADAAAVATAVVGTPLGLVGGAIGGLARFATDSEDRAKPGMELVKQAPDVSKASFQTAPEAQAPTVPTKGKGSVVKAAKHNR